MPFRIRSWRPAVAGATLAASVLLVPISAVAADAHACRRAATAATCRFARDPNLAARTSRDVRAALSYAQGGAAPAGTHDARSDLWCAIEESRRQESECVVRVLVTETVLRKADELRRRITDLKESDIRAVAPSSSIAATQCARPDDDPRPDHLPHDRLSRLADLAGGLLRRARLRSAEFGRSGLWSLTRTTPCAALQDERAAVADPPSRP
ncbi:hypothetical protein [Streptomyces sp. YIM 130001]|uniref:hypothetical protein n=1 Tax=Streptomyces sp. YIM 130001 TaxID=2259644 RepID=UPI0013C4EFA4|nr:hypothetical protein [Streptomyces sp. YIM 130001]